MSNVTRLNGKPRITLRYQAGDITRALAEGLHHDLITADIESALHGLLFIGGPEDVLAARELLSRLLQAQGFEKSIFEVKHRFIFPLR
jgi:hypothetical protein